MARAERHRFLHCHTKRPSVLNPIVQTQVGSNTVLATPFSNNINNGIIKIDHNFNKDNMLTGRYFLGDSEQSFPLALVGGGALPGYNTFTPTRVQLVSISFVSVLSPSIVNEARVGWNRFAEGFYPQDRHFDPASINLNTGASGVDLGLPVMIAASTGFPQLGSSASTHATATIPTGTTSTTFPGSTESTTSNSAMNSGVPPSRRFLTLTFADA